MRKSLFFFFLYMIGCLQFTEAGAANLPPKNILILQIVEHPALDATRQGIMDALAKAGLKASFESAQGNPALATQIAQKFVGSAPDLMVGIGTAASQALVSANRTHHIPIVFSSVTDPLGARLVSNLEKPNGDVTGVSNFIEPTKQFIAFKKLLPTLSTLGVIYNPGEANSISLIEKMQEHASSNHLKIVLATANSSSEVAAAAQSLVGKVDAIFINNDNTALSAFSAVANIAAQNHLPLFVSDVDMVNQGAFAALGPNQYAVGQKTGKMIIEILKGTKPGNIPVGFPDDTELKVNEAVKTKLGL